MPAPVDQVVRRREIAHAAGDLVAREGLEMLTFRKLADHIGYSTKTITHFFANKHDLMRWTYLIAAERSQERVDRALLVDPDDLQKCLEALLPLEPASQRDWRIYLSFWQEAAVHLDFAEEQRWWQNNTVTILDRIMAKRYGRTDDTTEDARMLIVFVQGLAAQVIFEDPYWTPARQRHVLARQIALLLGPPLP